MCWTVRTFLSVLAAALLISVLLFTPASAESGEALLSPGEERAWEVHEDSPFQLVYEVDVLSGQRVNVFLVTASEYQRLQADETFSYIREGSFTNVQQAYAEVDLEAGTYYLVVSPTPQAPMAGEDEVRLSYDITAMISSEDNSLTTVLTIGAMLLFGLVVVILVDVMSRRRRRA